MSHLVDYQFSVLLQTRKNFINLIDGFSLAKLNKVPAGFNNNLIWNFVHVICTQQVLCYKLAGMETTISADIIDRYRKGTAPQSDVSQKELDMFKELALSTVAKMEHDYKSGIFMNYNLYETSYGIKLGSIEDAIAFNNVHEGLHFGYSMALRKYL